MKFLDVNLASDPVRNDSPYYWAYGVLSGCVLVLLAYNLFAFTRFGGELARLQEGHRQAAFRLAEIQNQDRRHRQEIAGWDFPEISERAAFAGNAILRRTFSWTELFNQLESVVPPQVQLAAIRPNISAEGIQIRVDGIAKGQGSILEFIESLEGSERFRGVFPGAERREDGGMMTFHLTIDYEPPVPVPPAAPVQTAAEEAGGATGEAAAAAAGAAPERAGAEVVAGEEVPAPEPEAATAEPETGESGTDSEAAGEEPGGKEPDARAELGTAPTDFQIPRGARGGRPRARPSGAATPGTGAVSGPAAAPVWNGEVLLQGERVDALYRRLARLGKVSIVLEEGVDPNRRITARVRAETFEAALEKVAEATGHVLIRDGEGIYRIADPGRVPAPLQAPAVEESDLPGKTGEEEEEPAGAGPPEGPE